MRKFLHKAIAFAFLTAIVNSVTADDTISPAGRLGLDVIGNNSESVYDICTDTSVSAKLSSDSTLPVKKHLALANPASNKNQQTFLRFVNPSAESVDVELYGTDDSGVASKTSISFSLAAGESKQMTAQDLENGNTSKGLKSSLCDGTGKWQITTRSSKAIQIMGLIRSPDGFLTGLSEVVPMEAGSNIVYFANPASNTKQQTFLRIVNNSPSPGTVTITAVDNLGVDAAESVSFELEGNESKQMTTQDLENGNTAKGIDGKLGDGNGKWRLTIASSLDLSAQSLIRTPDGFLTNLSSLVIPEANGDSTLSFFNPASNTAQQSFMRLINSNTENSSVTISGVDDAGQIAPNGNISLTLNAGKSVELSANALEQGDTELQLNGSLGIGSGRWRLNIASEPQIKVMSYVLTSKGFLTNMSKVTGAATTSNEVWVFNPGSNRSQASKLRLINNGASSAVVTISGIDDDGNAGSGPDLTFNLSGGSVKEITGMELENGSSEKGLAGGIGDGKGKWRLTVTSDEPLTVQSLLETPAGFITNLSSKVTSFVSTNSAISTSGVECNYNYDTFNNSPSVNLTSIANWSCGASDRVLTANGVPDHDVGKFPNRHNPNSIEAQSISANFTLSPDFTSSAIKLGGPAGVIGYVLNGVKIDAGTAGSCSDSGTNCSLSPPILGGWSIEALGQTSFNFVTDDNHAHVQPGGTYHYHGIPEGFVTALDKGTAMTLIGWAADGFPIYARYGYQDPMDANSGVVIIASSYQLKTSPDENRPPVADYSLGTFTQDYEYVANSGSDLDECNGRKGVTPEFPGGIYHYYATDGFPFLQRCVKGAL